MIAHRDAFRSRQRADDDVHPVLLDQLAGHAYGRVRRRIRRAKHPFDGPSCHFAAELGDGQLDTADAVTARNREGAFLGDQHADLERLLSLCGQGYHQRRSCNGACKQSVHVVLPFG